MAARLPLQVVRSSGRIPKEIPILLIGSDLDGRVFSEPTKTVLLSLHGAGLLSRHKLSPEQELVLRWPERNKEAEIRVVGHVGSSADGHTYGVAFVDPSLQFWDIDFPPMSSAEMERSLLLLVCNSCKALEKIDDNGIEADIFATGDGVLRFCRRCGAATLWKPAQPTALPGVQEEAAPLASAQMPLFPGSTPPASPVPAQNSAEASALSHATSVLTLPAAERTPAPHPNRRKHQRVKVNYSACVRHPERGDDIVTCEDISKGGLRFKSCKRYHERSIIEVAAPYALGQPAIFVPAQIVFVEELPEQQLFRCGVAFLRPTRPRDSF